jgi:hypothetical protein
VTFKLLEVIMLQELGRDTFYFYLVINKFLQAHISGVMHSLLSPLGLVQQMRYSLVGM